VTHTSYLGSANYAIYACLLERCGLRAPVIYLLPVSDLLPGYPT
jgi:hypothetical protein